MKELIKDIHKLCEKHRIILSGKIRIIESDNERFENNNFEIVESIECGNGVTDRMGPFLLANPTEKPAKPADFIITNKMLTARAALRDVDILLKDGVKSPVDGRIYGNRKEWNDHLKARSCTEVGNDYNHQTEKMRQTYGRYDCRESLGKAVHQVFEKNGIKG